MFKVPCSKFKYQDPGFCNLEPGTWNLEQRARVARAHGVTLVEMIVVIAITGILAAAVAVFIRRPVEGYIDAARRAELSDIADTALRRITRDLRSALPNSVRVDAPGKYIEYLHTSGGGRYRAEVDSGGLGNTLDFITADTTFHVIGPALAVLGGESLVVVNLGAGSDPANAYASPPNNNREAIASIVGNTVTLSAAKLFPFASPGKRFQIVQYPVTYACEAGVLRRYWGYAIAPAQPVPPAGGSNALVATSVNVAACNFSYAPVAGTARTGVVSVTLEISQGGESVRLFQQAHVSNVP
jgi:MSHA biogenesis protein MshO